MKKIAIVDFGGQYTHLIARRIRDLGVFSEIIHPESFEINNDIVGIIFSGGPQSVNAEDAFRINLDIDTNEIPILGICYGHQLLAKMVGGEIESGENKEYGFTSVTCDPENSKLLKGLNSKQKVWMSHGDHVCKLPKDFKITAYSDSIKIASYESLDQKFFGVQFHPEVTHTTNGLKMLDKFISVCTNDRNWNPHNFKESLIQQIKDEAKGRKLVLLLSGGVDSLVALELSIQALGNENVYSIHIDTGFMRLNESKEILEHFDELGFKNVKIIEAEKMYLEELKGVVDPERKRMIIGKLFVDIANNELSKLGQNIDWMLVQGTIYPDTIESGSTDKAALIKTHHNRVDEIEKLIDEGKIIEPIKELYKDEVRKLGDELGLPEKLVYRHPFPGPGLAIRVICSDIEKNNNDLQIDNKHLSKILADFGLSGNILPIKSVGVQGDFRTYHHPAVIWFNEGIESAWEDLKTAASKVINKIQSVNRIVYSNQPINLQLKKLFLEKTVMNKLREVDAVLRNETDHIPEIWQMPVVSLPLFNETGQAFVMRPVCSSDAMTASVFEMEFTEIKRLSKLIQKIDGVGNLLYDVTTKPPGTIEWE